MDPIDHLHSLGQSLWYDNIQRGQLESGEFARLIEQGDIRGVTSNPSIFNNAIGKSSDYDSALVPMAWAGWTADQIFDRLALEDIQAAADLFLPLYQESQGGDGYVSLEVNPLIANSTEETIAEARRLNDAAGRPNVMIKIPATREGIPAIAASIAAGININITLIFSLTRYAEVMDAYLRGLEERAAGGHPIDQIASVASFFVSRVDSKVDQSLQEIVRSEGQNAEKANKLFGKAAIANAKLAYAKFMEVFQSERFLRLREKGARIQRPLWASTSTKNPAYPDVMYVEELVGPDTVNTVPPQTLDAFRDHGRPRVTITEGLDDARQALQNLEEVGISMEQVTHELEIEGVKAFADAFSTLLKTVEERRKAAQAELGPLQQSVSLRVAHLESEAAVQRMAAHDPSLWTPDKTGQAEIMKRLGWLDLPSSSRSLLSDIDNLADQLQDEGYTQVLLLGMGGSSLAPEVFQSIFAARTEAKVRSGLNLTILDSTDPEQVRSAARRSPVKQTLYIVSSKSGGTSEVDAFLAYFWDQAVRKLGKQAGDHFVAITDPGTELEKTALEMGFRKIFLADPMVGGRYSALTAFGLVPAGLAGIDLAQLLAKAQHFAGQTVPTVPAGRNPGLVLGAVMAEAALQRRDKLTLIADPEWSALGAWLEQLIAESSGKEGKGIVPIDGEDAGQPRLYGKDRLFVYLKSNGQMADSAHRLLQAGHPVITLGFKDPYQLGAELYRWETATAIACAVMGVNAFDQPDVQDNKTRTTEKIAAFTQTGSLPDGDPIWQSQEACVYGKDFSGLESAKTLAEVVQAFLGLAKEGDYLALNAYLPRSEKYQAQLHRLRRALRKRTRLATTVGFGPRFLHSTGQLHKGGADNGVFIQITTDPARDIAIPGKGFSFGTLEKAQALGDLEALQARGRRAIRIHLLKAKVRDLI